MGCGRSILILPGVGEDETSTSSDQGTGTGPLTIGEESGGTSSVCGDGVVEGDELCDGSNLDGWTCADFGFKDGVLSCTLGCTIDATGCIGGDPGTATGDGDTGPSTTGPSSMNGP